MSKRIKIKDFTPDDRNFNTHTPDGMELLKKSVEQVGVIESITVSADDKVISGNARQEKISEVLGEDVEPIVVETDGKRPVILKRTDIHSGTAEFHKAALLANTTAKKNINFNNSIIQQVAVEEYGIDVQELGVEIVDIEDDGHGKSNAAEDDYEAPEEIKTDITIGDLFEIRYNGITHRLLCGDSTKAEDVEKLMGGKKADMVFTDPPYGVSYADKNKYLNTIAPGNRIQIEIKNDHMNVEDTGEFVYKVFCNIKSILSQHSSYYITSPQGGDLMLMMMIKMKEDGIPLRHCLIWVKNNHVLGRTDYNYKHEPILYGWVDRHKFYGNGEHHFSTWEINKPLKNDLHPTMKPIALIVNALLNSTEENMICADLFGGSGSTLMACAQTNRIGRILELEPKYCQVILDRFKNSFPESEILKIKC